jgi:protein-S-isoprenylcysteine O-methyltransferase Ste14
LDILAFRVISVFFLSYIITLIILSSRSLTKDPRGSPKAKAEADVPKFTYRVWDIVTAFPVIMLFLAVIYPEAIYGTVLNVSFPGDTIVQVVAIIILCGVGILFYWSDREIGRLGVSNIQVAEDHELVTTGPYARVRHPGYLTYMLLGVAHTLFVLNLLLAVNYIVGAFVANYRAKNEEELLSSENGFGSEYREYMKRTGRFLPKFGIRGKRR